MADQPKMNRRSFAKTLAAAALAVPGGQAVSRAARPPDRRSAQQSDPSPTARSLTQVLRERFGNRFDDQQYQRFARDIETGLRRAATLRQHRLANADEPALVFLPYRRES